MLVEVRKGPKLFDVNLDKESRGKTMTSNLLRHADQILVDPE